MELQGYVVWGSGGWFDLPTALDYLCKLVLAWAPTVKPFLFWYQGCLGTLCPSSPVWDPSQCTNPLTIPRSTLTSVAFFSACSSFSWASFTDSEYFSTSSSVPFSFFWSACCSSSSWGREAQVSSAQEGGRCMCEGVPRNISKLSGRKRESRGGTVQPGVLLGPGGVKRKLPAPTNWTHHCSARAGVEIGD